MMHHKQSSFVPTYKVISRNQSVLVRREGKNKNGHSSKWFSIPCRILKSTESLSNISTLKEPCYHARSNSCIYFPLPPFLYIHAIAFEVATVKREGRIWNNTVFFFLSNIWSMYKPTPTFSKSHFLVENFWFICEYISYMILWWFKVATLATF